MKNGIKESYNKICNQWCEFRNSRPVNKCIVDFASSLKPNARILDVGCGAGYPIDSYLTKKGFNVTGIDISEEMIKRAKQLNLQNSSFFVCDILNFKSNEKYDAIIAFDSIWHINHEKQEKIYSIISSLILPGGLFLFTHGKEDGEIFGTMWGEKFYHSALSLKKLYQVLNKNGFEIVSSIENYFEETTGDRDLLMIVKKK